MVIIANVIAILSLIAYCYGIFNGKNSVLMICFAIGDIIYSLSYVLLGEYLTASSFILSIFLSFTLGIFSHKKIKVPIYVYIIAEILEIISFIVFYNSPLEFIVLIASMQIVFFECYDNEIMLQYSIALFGILLLIYNILISFVLGIIMESVILISTTIEIIRYYRKKRGCK